MVLNRFLIYAFLCDGYETTLQNLYKLNREEMDVGGFL